MSILIKQALLGNQSKDIYIEGNKIHSIADNLNIDADKIIDGKGKAAIQREGQDNVGFGGFSGDGCASHDCTSCKISRVAVSSACICAGLPTVMRTWRRSDGWERYRTSTPRAFSSR